MKDRKPVPEAERCKMFKARRPGGMFGSRSRCKRAALRDGYCAQHHPDAVAARRAKREAGWEADERQRRLADAIRAAERAALRAAMTRHEYHRFDPFKNDQAARRLLLDEYEACEVLRELRVAPLGRSGS